MYDYKKELVQALCSLGYPVKYELFLKQNQEVPAISYRQANNIQDITGDTLGYSELSYYIKVWSKKEAELTAISLELDDVMRNLGFTRTNAVELWADGIGQIEYTYSALAKEDY